MLNIQNRKENIRTKHCAFEVSISFLDKTTKKPQWKLTESSIFNVITQRTNTTNRTL